MTLASPLSARAEAEAAASAPRSLLRMAVGGEVLAVPIEEVREILEVGRLTALPRTPDFVRGVMNLRGAVVPVIDLAARVGRGSTEIGRRSCIVVVDTRFDDEDDAASEADALPIVGLLVDAVYEVFDIDASQIEPVPMLGTRIRPDFLAGMTRARGQVLGVLALARVLAARELTEGIAGFHPA